VFMDYRFSTSYCRSFLPLWVRDGLRVLPNREGLLGEELRVFFKTHFPQLRA
jgi:hypothetical protein